MGDIFRPKETKVDTKKSQTGWKPIQSDLNDSRLVNKAAYQDASLFDRNYGDETRNALSMQRDLGQNESNTEKALSGVIDPSRNLYQTSMGHLQDTMSGGMGNQGPTNPYFEGQLAQGQRGIADYWTNQAAASGRTGSGSHEYAQTKAMQEANNTARYTNWRDEQARMDDMARYNAQNQLGNLTNAAGGLDNALAGRQGMLSQAGQGYDTLSNEDNRSRIAQLDYMNNVNAAQNAFGTESQGTQTTTQSADPFGALVSAGTGLLTAWNSPGMGGGSKAAAPAPAPASGGSGWMPTNLFNNTPYPTQSTWGSNQRWQAPST